MPKRTALYDIEKSLGAAFDSRAVPGPEGRETVWEVASIFSGPDEEYNAVRRSVGLMDLSTRGKILITGPDRVRFLNGQVTNDVKKLIPGQGCCAAALDYKGALVGDLKVYSLEDALWIDTAETCTQKLFDHLQRFAISDEVEITEETDGWSHLGLHGPRSTGLLNRIADKKLDALEEYQHLEVRIGSIGVRVIRADYTGETGYDLIVAAGHAPDLWTHVATEGKTDSLHYVGLRTQEVLRLEAGLPLFGVDMTEEHLALEANLMSAISTTKGCYTGQEVVTRIINRGHVNRILVGFRLKGQKAPNPGDGIFLEEKAVGTVTSSAFSPQVGGPIALGYVPSAHSEPGTIYIISEGSEASEAEVVALPFYRRN